MSDTDAVAGKDIVKLLLLMFLVERAIGGFIRWAYKDAPDQFDKHFRDYLNSQAEKDRNAGAKEIHFTIANVSEFLTRVKQQPQQPGLRGGVDRMRRLADEIRQLAICRNTVMHGDIPETDIWSLVELTAHIFSEISGWVSARRLIDPITGDVFPTWRYLNLQQPEIEDILERQSLCSETIDVQGDEITFIRRLQYDKAAASKGRSRKLEIIETWISARERPRTPPRHIFDKLAIEKLKKSDELSMRAVKPIRPDFRPIGHDSDPFGVPFWEPLDDREAADYLAISVE